MKKEIRSLNELKAVYGLSEEEEVLTVSVQQEMLIPVQKGTGKMTDKQLSYALDMAHALNMPYNVTIKFSTLTYEEGTALIEELKRAYNKITPATERQKAKIREMLICPDIYQVCGQVPIERLTVEQASRLIARFRTVYEEWLVNKPTYEELIKVKSLYKKAEGREMPPEIEGFINKDNVKSFIKAYAREVGILKQLAYEEKVANEKYQLNVDDLESEYPTHSKSKESKKPYAGFNFIENDRINDDMDMLIDEIMTLL
jgi:hypothetical protein